MYACNLRTAGMWQFMGFMGRLAACVATAPLCTTVAYAAGTDGSASGSAGRRGRGRPRGPAAPPADPAYNPAAEPDVRPLGSQHLYNAILERLANDGAGGNPAGRVHPRPAGPVLPAGVHAAPAAPIEALPYQHLYTLFSYAYPRRSSCFGGWASLARLS